MITAKALKQKVVDSLESNQKGGNNLEFKQEAKEGNQSGRVLASIGSNPKGVGFWGSNLKGVCF